MDENSQDVSWKYGHYDNFYAKFHKTSFIITYEMFEETQIVQTEKREGKMYARYATVCNTR